MQKIMFNDAVSLTDAVLRGRKTNTRRDELNDAEKRTLEIYNVVPFVKNSLIVAVNPETCFLLLKKPTRYKVGEIVAVAQSYRDAGVRFLPEEDDEFGCHEFPAEQTSGWNNKMFVRADIMPHQIRITGIRIERLQDISEDDCIREGITYKPVSATKPYGIVYGGNRRMICLGATPREAYAALIDRVSGSGTWERNPYVVVYDYKLVK